MTKNKNNYAWLKLKRKVKWLFVVILIIVAVVLLVHWIFPVSSRNDEEKTITRNLDKAWNFIDQKPETMPEMAWGENIPKFIQDDIKEVLEDGWIVKYKYGDCVITLETTDSMYDDELYLKLYVMYEDFRDRNMEYLWRASDLSIYKSDDILYIYAWTGIDREKFEELIVSKNYFSNKIFYNPSDVPIGKSDQDSWQIGDYALVQKGDTFSIWNNGVLIDEEKFECNELWEFSEEFSLIGTDNGDLYAVNIYSSRETSYRPKIYFEKIGKVDEIKPIQGYQGEFLTFEFPREHEYTFPIFKKDGEPYACLPEDMRSYASYTTANKGEIGFYSEDMNLCRKLVKLDENIFSHADIYYGYIGTLYDSFCWGANVYFEYNGISYYLPEVPIFGYDRQYGLTDEEKARLTRTVYSVEDYWKAVNAIRKTYEAYYEQPK